MEIKVGQVVYVVERYDKNEPVDSTIKKVGRKYIEVNYNYRTIRFSKDSLKDATREGFISYELYLDKHEWVYKQECSKLKQFIEKANLNMLSLEQLREIKEIIEKGDPYFI